MIELGEKLRDDFKSTFTRRIEGDVAGSYANMALLGGIMCGYYFIQNGDSWGAVLVGSAILEICYGAVENGIKVAVDNTKDVINTIRDVVARK